MNNEHTENPIQKQEPARRSPSLQDVIDYVADEFGVTRRELASKHRHPSMVASRWLIAHVGHAITTATYPTIARAVKGPLGNHSTFIEGAHNIEKGRVVEAPVPKYAGRSFLDVSAEIAETIREGRFERRPHWGDREIIDGAYHPDSDRGRRIDDEGRGFSGSRDVGQRSETRLAGVPGRAFSAC